MFLDNIMKEKKEPEVIIIGKSSEESEGYEHRRQMQNVQLERQRQREIQLQMERQRQMEVQQQLELQSRLRKIEEEKSLENQKRIEEQKRRLYQQWKAESEAEKTQKSLELNKEIIEKEKLRKEDDISLITMREEIRNRKQIVEKNNEGKKRLQQNMAECSRLIRDMQQSIKETYQFEPCHHLCELLINIRQNVYKNMEDVQEDLEYVVEMFGINEITPLRGEVFDAKYHYQVHSNAIDARGKVIKKIYASGFEMDGEVITKAQVSVEE